MIDLFALEILPLKRRTAQEGIPLLWLLSQHQGEGSHSTATHKTGRRTAGSPAPWRGCFPRGSAVGLEVDLIDCSSPTYSPDCSQVLHPAPQAG